MQYNNIDEIISEFGLIEKTDSFISQFFGSELIKKHLPKGQILANKMSPF